MKTLFTILLLVSVSAWSQTPIDKAYQHTYNAPHNFVVQIGSRMLFSSTPDYHYNQQNITFLHNVGTDGSELPLLQIPMGSVPGAKAIMTLDSCLLMIGIIRPPCTSSQGNTGWLIKVDRNNQAVFSTSFAINPGQVNGLPKVLHLVQTPDSNIMVMDRGSIHRFDMDGNYITTLNTGYFNISSPLLLSDSTVLITCMKPNAAFARVNMTGNIVSYTPAPVSMYQLSSYGNNQFIGLGKDKKFYKFSPTLAAIGLPSSSFFSTTEFTVLSDSLYVTNEYLPGAGMSVLDTTFSSVITNSVHLFLRPAAMCMTSEKKLALLSGGEDGFTSFNYVNRHSGYAFTRDLTLVRANFDTLDVIDSAGYRKGTVKMTAVVRNTGLLPVSSFKLYCQLDGYPPPYQCATDHFSKKYTPGTLQPGDSITVTTGIFTCWFYYVNDPYLTQFCLSVVLPDGTTDSEQINSRQCITKLPIGIDEVATENDLILFPNPNNGEFEMRSERERIVRINNLSGQLIKQIAISPGVSRIEVSGLSPGLYIVESISKNGSVSRIKMMKH